ncbi:ATP-dependent Clp protease ATP-binding subunit ClpA, partial [candidate division KSB3 bacterium]|nr:ATP-dependent Clp protease ATP-binding subunit ClpA [candidate division KSB3 bacterium]MBD3325381.1 ATP-dependent Clp protease ATP-binding subunit ClpA [candidate division KSB3 bacterium]
EFRNRLTEIVYFNALTPALMERIVEKFIDELNLQLIGQQIHLILDPPAKQWLAQHGYDEMYGARPLARLIQTTIRQPLAEEILFGSLQDGGTAQVTMENDTITIQVQSPVASERTLNT